MVLVTNFALFVLCFYEQNQNIVNHTNMTWCLWMVSQLVRFQVPIRPYDMWRFILQLLWPLQHRSSTMLWRS